MNALKDQKQTFVSSNSSVNGLLPHQAHSSLGSQLQIRIRKAETWVMLTMISDPQLEHCSDEGGIPEDNNDFLDSSPPVHGK